MMGDDQFIIPDEDIKIEKKPEQINKMDWAYQIWIFNILGFWGFGVLGFSV